MTTQSNSNNSNSQETKAGFTPGPWECIQHLDKSWGIHQIPDDGEPKGSGFILGVFGHAGLTWNTSEAKANARLIAAAPAMYEALQEIAKCIGEYDIDRLKHASNTIENMKRLAVEALQKAGGVK